MEWDGGAAFARLDEMGGCVVEETSRSELLDMDAGYRFGWVRGGGTCNG